MVSPEQAHPQVHLRSYSEGVAQAAPPADCDVDGNDSRRVLARALLDDLEPLRPIALPRVMMEATIASLVESIANAARRSGQDRANEDEEVTALDDASHLGLQLGTRFNGDPRALSVLQRHLSAFCPPPIMAAPGVTGDSRRPDTSWFTARVVEGFCARSRELVVREQQVIHKSVLDVMADAQQALFESESRFRAVFESSIIGILICDMAGRIVSMNPSLLALTGGTIDKWTGEPASGLVDTFEGDTQSMVAFYRAFMAGVEQHRSLQGELVFTSGTSIWAHLVNTIVREANGKARYIVTLIQDMSDRQSYEASLRSSEERVRQLIQNSSDLIAVVTDTGTIDFVSANIARILGHEANAVEGTPFQQLVADDSVIAFNTVVEEVRSGRRSSARSEVMCMHRNQSWRWMEIVCTEMEGAWRTPGIIINARDITERKAFQHQLERQAYFDGLTALPNRLHFRSLTDTALRSGQSLALLFIDLDRFKMINDSQDHGGGDHAIVAVGQRILDTLIAGETVGRFGGDEFAVLVENASLPQAIATASRILEALERPISLQHHETAVGCSIGIAMSGPTLDTSNALLRAADIAMYKAKANGGGQAVVYEPAMLRETVARIELATALHDALDHGEFESWYEPEFDLFTGELRAFGVVTRWNRPGVGLVDYDEFRTQAEELGLLTAINRWQLEDAARQVQRWLAAGIDESKLAFSVRVSDGSSPGGTMLVSSIREVLASTRIEPQRLRIDFDSRAITDGHIAPGGLASSINALGVSFGIDNFGVGYHPLAFLSRMNAQMIKFDRDFIQDGEELDARLAILKAVTTLAHNIGVRVAIAGLDSARHVDYARLAGCDQGLGPAFSPRLRAAKMEQLLRTAQ